MSLSRLRRKLFLPLAMLSFSAAMCLAQQVPVGPPPGSIQDTSPSRPSNPDKNAPKPSGGEAGASVDSNTYKIGPADVLGVKVWDDEKFTGNYVVHQDGSITMPLLGDLKAGDTTPHETEAAITKALLKYMTKPLVTVTVVEVGSKKYYLDGMVNKPGEYALATPTTVLEAISKAGGLQDFANKKRIYILRGSSKIPFNFKDVMNGKNMDQNIQLQSGDHIVVP